MHPTWLLINHGVFLILLDRVYYPITLNLISQRKEVVPIFISIKRQ
jgi:hypothetical protein